MPSAIELLMVVGLAGALLLSWALATVRNGRVRAARSAEWQGSEGRAELWTSAACCPTCGAAGGLVEPTPNGGAVFTCLACDAHHVREHRG